MALIFILLLIAFIWIAVLSFFIFRTHSFFSKLVNIKSDNLGEVLRRIIKNQEASKKEFSEIFNEIARIDKEKDLSIQRVGFVKYRPFGREESDNSFCTALLDNHGNGIVITSLQLSDRARVYAKDINHGRSSLPLSKEEKDALAKAMKFTTK